MDDDVSVAAGMKSGMKSPAQPTYLPCDLCEADDNRPTMVYATARRRKRPHACTGPRTRMCSSCAWTAPRPIYFDRMTNWPEHIAWPYTPHRPPQGRKPRS